MAEARSEEEEENMMRDTREQVVRRAPNSSGGRSNRRKPEHRLRRPEITILSAEPLASTSWFPGASGGFPPPPPPAAQIWGPTIPPSIQPPPSYEEVIREKTQEQVLPPPPPPPPSSSSSSSSSSSRPASTITIATQTDPGSAPEPQIVRDSQERRPVRPLPPPVPFPRKPADVANVITSSQSALPSVDGDGVVPDTHPLTHTSAHTQCCDLFTDPCSPLSSTSGAQTGQWDKSSAAVDAAALPTASSHVPLERPRPRPRLRSRLSAPVGSDVKVQTLVKLREDGLATLAARAGADAANRDVSQGKYLQELLQAFSADDWGFPERRSDSSEHSQSESGEEDEGEEDDEDEEDMATLKARIQAFEQQQVADGSCADGKTRDFEVANRPEPRPRPRLLGQPAKSVPPTVAPKPKNLSHAPKPSSKDFWEDGGLTVDTVDSGCTKTDPPTASGALKSAPALVPEPCTNTVKPAVSPKPQSARETLTPGTPSSAPVPAPRPPPPKLAPSVSETPSSADPKPPPRPPVAPRTSLGGQPQDKITPAGHVPLTPPPRPSSEVCSGAPTETQAGGDETQQYAANQTVKLRSGRPGVPTKPAALTSPRRASAPSGLHLAPKPTGVSPSPPDSNPVPPKPTAAAPAIAHRPSGPALVQSPGLKLPAPALRKGPVIQTKPETSSTANPSSSDPPLPPRPSSAKLLPLRPPPIKSTPGRPPPPAVTSNSSSNQTTPPRPKTCPAPSVSPAGQSSSSQTTPSSSSVSANQRASKRGPPLPPRPKPGHPLYTSYVKQEVLIVLDDPSPPEPPPGEGKTQTSVINPSQCLLDLDIQPEPAPDPDNQSKSALEGFSLSDSQSILPVHPTEQKEPPDSPPVSGPRCVALFDYEGEDDDELTFSQGDVIALLEIIGQEWGRGQIHGRIGIFPLNFAEVVEPPPQPAPSPGETGKPTASETTATKRTAPTTSKSPDSETEWAVALFDFPGQTAEDLSFHKGALIQVTLHIDAEWRRGRLEGREGIYPAAFTQACQAQPIPGQKSAVKGVAKFDFTAESEDELTVKVGDIITQVEFVDEQWILGVVGGKRGIVPTNYISLLS
ncbi:SH3 domain-containing protein 19-like [Etheostoma cragini]|uniref:SH3 domain-containing protein 19-like n=1 Tax=Etheostoma cragini TaxID=417921 RepID=UPI00155E1DB9|nr:SH3 domain-containing protein 19-like [Etheostoma cragini]